MALKNPLAKLYSLMGAGFVALLAVWSPFALDRLEMEPEKTVMFVYFMVIIILGYVVPKVHPLSYWAKEITFVNEKKMALRYNESISATISHFNLFLMIVVTLIKNL